MTDPKPTTLSRTVIERRSRLSLGLVELWSGRELLAYLVGREIKIRYKQTFFGAGWAVLQPTLTMVTFAVIFGHVAGIAERTPVPYPVYAFVALLPWQLFARALTDSSVSLATNRSLVTKVYFPRVFIPLAPILAGLADFACAFVALVALMVVYGLRPGPGLLLVPPLVLLACAVAFGVGLWLSSLNAMYRDVRHALGMLVQLWLLASPVAYPTHLVRAQWRWLYDLNPMVGVIDGFRWALLGEVPTSLHSLFVSSLAAVVLVVSGLLFFRRMEGRFADVV